MKVIKEQAEKIITAGLGMVLSGSPRTYAEAFGAEGEEGVIELLERAYGQSKLFLMNLLVAPETSIVRNSHRQLCKICGRQLMYGEPHTRCPFCGGELYTRVFDNTEKVNVRLIEFKERTEPILAELRKRGGKNFCEIDGEALPFLVHGSIVRRIESAWHT